MHTSTIELKKNNCMDCHMPCSRQSRRCKKCNGTILGGTKIGKTKMVWPDIDYLIDKIKNVGYVALSKELDVSYNAIRKHIKSKGFNLKKLVIL